MKVNKPEDLNYQEICGNLSQYDDATIKAWIDLPYMSPFGKACIREVLRMRQQNQVIREGLLHAAKHHDCGEAEGCVVCAARHICWEEEGILE